MRIPVEISHAFRTRPRRLLILDETKSFLCRRLFRQLLVLQSALRSLLQIRHYLLLLTSQRLHVIGCAYASEITRAEREGVVVIGRLNALQESFVSSRHHSAWNHRTTKCRRYIRLITHCHGGGERLLSLCLVLCAHVLQLRHPLQRVVSLLHLSSVRIFLRNH